MALSDVRQSADDGYFPRGRSVLRRIHEERAVGLFFGQRALMIGALHPVAFTGTLENTAGRVRPFRRLAHTGRMFEEVFFGTRAEADAALAFVRRLHDRVDGELPNDAGPFAAGTRYSAYDPELMLWTMAVIADSAPYFYELFVRRLTEAEKDALWQDYLLFAELFGMPRGGAPQTWREFRAWWDGLLASQAMHLTPDARYVGYATAFEIPLPAARQPAKRVHDLIMLGSLPPRVRELYGLGFGRTERLAFRAAVAALRAARPVTPDWIRRGRCGRSYDLVARTERERIESGKYTPQVDVAAAR
jgi:uncharacterized protein (DUF2236 family)